MLNADHRFAMFDEELRQKRTGRRSHGSWSALKLTLGSDREIALSFLQRLTPTQQTPRST
jgi:hypothetical protein